MQKIKNPYSMKEEYTCNILLWNWLYTNNLFYENNGWFNYYISQKSVNVHRRRVIGSVQTNMYVISKFITHLYPPPLHKKIKNKSIDKNKWKSEDNNNNLPLIKQYNFILFDRNIAVPARNLWLNLGYAFIFCCRFISRRPGDKQAEHVILFAPLIKYKLCFYWDSLCVQDTRPIWAPSSS